MCFVEDGLEVCLKLVFVLEYDLPHVGAGFIEAEGGERFCKLFGIGHRKSGALFDLSNNLYGFLMHVVFCCELGKLGQCGDYGLR